MTPKPCTYCCDGRLTGLPGNACENCMNTGWENGIEPLEIYDASFDCMLIWREGVEAPAPDLPTHALIKGRSVEGVPFCCRVSDADWSKIVTYQVVS